MTVVMENNYVISQPTCLR